MTHHSNAVPWYRSETWLVVELAAFVPIALAFMLPPTFQLPLFGLGAILALSGLGMLIARKPSPGDATGSDEFGFGRGAQHSE